MAETVVIIVMYAGMVYLVTGLGFAIWFAFAKVDAFDENARGSSILFRLLIIPASMALWPYLIKRMIESRKKL